MTETEMGLAAEAAPLGDIVERVLADVKPAAGAAPSKKVFVPQGYTARDEIVAIRSVLKHGDAEQALQRLDVWLDRYQGQWRCGGGAAW